MAKKRVVVDSSSIISISERCLINVLRRFAENDKVEFFIPQTVYNESVVTPMQIQRFELNAMRIKRAVDENWIKVAKSDQEIKRTLMKIEDLTDKMFFVGGKPLKFIQRGEAETLALLKKLDASTLIIDERNTRMLIEDPHRLADYMAFKYNEKVAIEEKRLREFLKFVGDVNIARSVELIALAFEKNYFDGELQNSKAALAAAMYAVKFAGCAVSINEIKQYLDEVGG